MSIAREHFDIAPLRLGPNRPRHFYRGGAQIAEFRGLPDPSDEFLPEDWIGSTTSLGWTGRDEREGESVVTVAGGGDVLLKDLLREHADAILGSNHVNEFGPHPALLVKLLDPAVRLPLHYHPSRSFARKHLHSTFGKTEAWVVLRTASSDAFVHLGFSRTVDDSTLSSWIDSQQVGELLDATHRLSVGAGDVVFVPAGIPHAIGPGILIVELQEPTNFSLFLEHAGFVRPEEAHAGLGWPVALGALRHSAVAASELREHFVRHVDLRSGYEERVFSDETRSFFDARWLCLDGGQRRAIDTGFAVCIVTSGSGCLVADATTTAIRRGDTYLVPAALGAYEVRASAEGLTLLRCLPPTADAGPALGVVAP